MCLQVDRQIDIVLSMKYTKSVKLCNKNCACKYVFYAHLDARIELLLVNA